MPDVLDRNPHHYIPTEFEERAKLWITSAAHLASVADPYISISVENLMYAERQILQMERDLARRDPDSPNQKDEPWLLMECSALSILWLCGLYEVTRGLRATNSPKFPAFQNLHNKLQLLRIPLAKHEVTGAPGYRHTSHYPTSVWSAETGRVGWRVFNPASKSFEAYFRADLADEFLGVKG